MVSSVQTQPLLSCPTKIGPAMLALGRCLAFQQHALGSPTSWLSPGHPLRQPPLPALLQLRRNRPPSPEPQSVARLWLSPAALLGTVAHLGPLVLRHFCLDSMQERFGEKVSVHFSFLASSCPLQYILQNALPVILLSACIWACMHACVRARVRARVYSFVLPGVRVCALA